MLFGGAATAGLIHACAVASGLLSSLVFARAMSTAEFGLYGRLISEAALLSVIAGLGIPLAILRFVPEYVVRRETDLLQGVIRFAQRTTIVVPGLAAVALSAWHGIARESGSKEQAFDYAAAMLLMVVMAWGLYQTELARSLRRFALAYVPMRVVWPALTAVMPAAAWTLGMPLTCGEAVLGSTAVLAGILLWQSRRVRSLIGTPEATAAYRNAYRKWFSAVAPLWVVACGSAAIANLDVIAVGALCAPTEAAAYFAAKKVSALVAFGQFAIVSFVAPQATVMFYRGDKRRLARLLGGSIAVSVVASLLCVVILAVWGVDILELFGGEFVVGGGALTILAGSQLIASCSGAGGPLLNASGREGATALISAAAALLLGVLCALLVPRYGLVGAAYSVGAVAVVRALPMLTLSVMHVSKMSDLPGEGPSQ